MVNSPFDGLTDDQKACLRLALLGHTSKEIGPRLGISSHTVDARLKAAMRVLGAGSRMEAARMLGTQERGTLYQPLVCQSPVLPQQTDPAIVSSSPVQGEVDRKTKTVVREEVVPFDVTAAEPSILNSWLSIPVKGRPKNDLDAFQKLIRAVFLAFLLVALLGALVSLQGKL